jgi:hypothetical protein
MNIEQEISNNEVGNENRELNIVRLSLPAAGRLVEAPIPT